MDGFNCSCEGGTWICRILLPGTALCMPCPDAGITGNMTTARHEHTATLLPIGKVLIAGGETRRPVGEMGIVDVTASTELYDPATGTFTATGEMTTARYQHSATLLPSGKVLITGGLGNWPPVETASAELYDPASGTFSATGSMTVARQLYTATLLGNGKVLIAGGVNVGASAELYDPAAGTFAATGNMTNGMAGHTATLLPSGKVLLAGGGSAQLYNPSTATFAATGTTPPFRFRHAATLLPSGKVLLVGGQRFGAESCLVDAELYDPTAETFTPTTGSMGVDRCQPTATLLLSGEVLVTGAIDNQSPGSAELYDPATGTFTPTGNMSVARTAAFTATLLLSGRVLIAGGEDDKGTFLASAELYE